MANTVETIDFDAIFEDITSRLEAEQRRRLQPARIRFYDGDWNFRGECGQAYSVNATFLNNDVGTAQVDMPLDYYLSRWVADVDARGSLNIHVVIEKDGARWSGRMDSFTITKEDSGRKICRVTFKHDLAELQKILVWANPWLPLAIQFPRLWVMFSRARRACKTTVLVNLIRLFGGSMSLFGDPLTPGTMNSLPLNPADESKAWPIVMKPDMDADTSPLAIVFSRFKNAFDTCANTVEDAQLTWECRRFLEGDEPPWPGADLRHGTLVIDLVDKSGWNRGTSFGGSLFSGMLHEMIEVGEDGLSETVHTLPDPNIPDLYTTPGAMGTDFSAPFVVFREGEYTGIQTSEFTYHPPTHVRTVGGGHSAPFVNELISAGVQAAGDLTAMIPGVPPLGGAIDAVLKPLYTDVFLAFGGSLNRVRQQNLGWSHYMEGFAEGSDRAYTLSWVLAMRGDQWLSRETTSHTLKVTDGAPWKVGERGHGHFFIGDRVGSTVLGLKPGKIFVDRVSELTISWDRDTTPFWEITIGQRESKDPLMEAFKRLQDLLSMIHDIGLL